MGRWRFSGQEVRQKGAKGRRVRRLGERLGIECLSPQDLRHVWARRGGEEEVRRERR